MKRSGQKRLQKVEYTFGPKEVEDLVIDGLRFRGRDKDQDVKLIEDVDTVHMIQGGKYAGIKVTVEESGWTEEKERQEMMSRRVG